MRNADAHLDAIGAHAKFTAKADGSGVLSLKSNPTRYEVLHELQHFADFRRLGYQRFKMLSRVQQEQSAYDALRHVDSFGRRRRWDALTKAQQTHAWKYIFRLGGNPF